jgi:hypothetical protein
MESGISHGDDGKGRGRAGRGSVEIMILFCIY